MGHNALQFTTRNPKIYCRAKCAMLSICFRRVAPTLPSNADPLSLKYQLLARLRLDLVLVYIAFFMLLNASAFTFCNLCPSLNTNCFRLFLRFPALLFL